MSAQMQSYEQSLSDMLDKSAISDRDLIASILLDAVEQSFLGDQDQDAREARRWLSGFYAQSLMILLDISPEAALEHLHRKWLWIDADARPLVLQ